VIEVSPWSLLVAAPLILALGQRIVRAPVLARLHVPGAVVGGLLVAFVMLVANLGGYQQITLLTKVASPAWTWVVSPGVRWHTIEPQDIHLPIMIGFFTCVGLSGSWSVVRRGGRALLIFLGLATCLGVLQNVTGLAVAKGMNASPYLGLLCGGLALTGGLGTIFGFGPIIEKAGFIDARAVGAAAATFGLVTGGLLSGPIGGWLIARYHLKQPKPQTPACEPESDRSPSANVFMDVRALVRFGRPLLWHILIILTCMKIGAWISFAVGVVGLAFPAQIGAMISGIVIRNVDDAVGTRVIVPAIVRVLITVLLGLFLAMAMSGINLLQLIGHGKAMMVILAAQVGLMAGFAVLVTFPVMGSEYVAALIAAGHTGFGLGITPNAIASMDLLTRRFGPAPQAVLVVTFVGAFLIDITNSLVATFFLNFLV
jgi:ESS family glutamate:Na+ symporter